jgi:hypothetical protein
MEGHPDDPPGAVSDQNHEEAESALRDDRAHPEPRTTGQRDRDRSKPDEDAPAGAAGEGSQSTGHPRDAG